MIFWKKKLSVYTNTVLGIDRQSAEDLYSALFRAETNFLGLQEHGNSTTERLLKHGNSTA
jgi:hypothetical protein